MAELGQRLECPELLLPAANAAEAVTLSDALPVIGLRHFTQAVLHLTGVESLTAWPASPLAASPSTVSPDLSEVRGQETAKRALEVAAAGGHNLLFLGPPGGGKTMLARRFPGLLPPLTSAEAITITKIYSLVAEEPQTGLRQVRPFRSPHTGTSTDTDCAGAAETHPVARVVITVVDRGRRVEDAVSEIGEAPVKRIDPDRLGVSGAGRAG